MAMFAPETMDIKAMWDEEANVYVATSEDVPGLVTEAPNLDELVKKLEIMIPELFELNGYQPPVRPIPVNLTTPLQTQFC